MINYNDDINAIVWWTGAHTSAICRYNSSYTGSSKHAKLKYLPFLALSGVPPWNNAGCKLDMSVQLNVVNPYPAKGGKDVWHPPSKQVSLRFSNALEIWPVEVSGPQLLRVGLFVHLRSLAVGWRKHTTPCNLVSWHILLRNITIARCRTQKYAMHVFHGPGTPAPWPQPFLSAGGMAHFWRLVCGGLSWAFGSVCSLICGVWLPRSSWEMPMHKYSWYWTQWCDYLRLRTAHIPPPCSGSVDNAGAGRTGVGNLATFQRNPPLIPCPATHPSNAQLRQSRTLWIFGFNIVLVTHLLCKVIM